jgi:hypothetical protein
MVRSIWIRSLVVALASTGFTWGQQMVVPASQPGERIITVDEAGKPAQKCRVLKTWRQADGTRAYQVESLDTGEIITIVEGGSPGESIVPSGPSSSPLGSRVREMTSRIIHWGKNRTPPDGVPMPPATTETVLVDQQPRRTEARPYAAAAPGTEARPYAAVTPGTTSWPSAHAEGGAPIISSSEGARLAGTPTLNPSMGPRIVNPMVTTPASSGSTPTGTAALPGHPCADCEESQPLVTTGRKPLLEKPTIEPAQPSDWHQSWGKDNSPKPPAVSKTETPPLSLPRPASLVKTELPLADTKPPASLPPPAPLAKTELPHADTSRPDPLKDPGSYRTPAVSDKMNKLPAVTSKPNAAEPLTAPDSDLKSLASEMQAEFSKGQQLPGSKQPLPLGAQSVVAAGQPVYVPVPVVTIPDVRRPPEPPKPQMPGAPQPNQQDWVNAFTPPQTAPSRPQQPPLPAGVQGQMANAFSPVPMPPNPTMQGMSPNPMMMTRGMYPANQMMMAQAAYPPPMPGMMPPAGYAPYGMATGQAALPDASAMRPAASNQPLVATLRDALQPSQREWAADKLALLDWRTNPQAVEALVKAAREDPATAVRAACIRSLGKMNANTLPVVSALQALKADPDALIQREVDQALASLTSSQPASEQPVLPASGRMPARPQ